MSDIAPKHWCGKSSRATQVRSATDAEINSRSAPQELVELGEKFTLLNLPKTTNDCPPSVSGSPRIFNRSASYCQVSCAMQGDHRGYLCYAPGELAKRGE